MAKAATRRGRGRPSDGGLLSRESIIAAGRKIIAAEGHEALSLRRLGSELGVTAPAMYAHVASKEALLRAVAHAEFDWFIDQYANLDEPDPIERLRYMSRHYIEFAQQNPELFRLMTTFPPEFFRREVFDPRSGLDSFGARLFRPRAVAVAEAIEDGTFVDDDPFLIGLIAFAAVHGLASVLLWRPPIDADFEQQLVDRFVDVVLRGLMSDGEASG